MSGRRDSSWTLSWVGAAAFLLSLFTVYLHLKALGRAYVVDYQIPRHAAMLAGTAGNPWQYRVLSAWIVEGAQRLLAAVGVHDPLIAAFVAVRVVEQTLWFVVAWLYWRSLGLASAAATLGLALLGWSVSGTRSSRVSAMTAATQCTANHSGTTSQKNPRRTRGHRR